MDFDLDGMPRAKPKKPLLVLAVAPHDGDVEIDVSGPDGMKPQFTGNLPSRTAQGPKPYLAALVFGK
jgi:hypothetical protein